MGADARNILTRYLSKQEQNEQSAYENPYGGGPIGHGQEHYTHHYNRDLPGSSRPMLPDPASLYESDNPLALVPYTNPVTPNLSTPQNLSSLSGSSIEKQEDPEWTKSRSRLKERFNITRPKYGPGGQIAPSTELVPNTEPLQYYRGQEHVVPPVIQVTHRGPPPVMVDMHSFTIWIGDHAVDHHKSAKVSELAERVRHNITGFASGIESYTARRETARRPQWNNYMEEVYQRGRGVEALYQTIVAKYDGPFKRKRDCSKSERAEAQRLLKLMFGRDYDIWDGLNWHANHWISHFNHLSS
ncbi:hypothetical protein FHL15_004528 [Xylaria flabelliformis]|uniref:Uncharacterized protein n=1 Tax=Xylaria flabelliformis TaxID=2512241 RepID=A0A553I302_9PEZI|nr:hypothetical protein FHL15_004528 [Xylaria flabelliformis]